MNDEILKAEHYYLIHRLCIILFPRKAVHLKYRDMFQVIDYGNAHVIIGHSDNLLLNMEAVAVFAMTQKCVV